MVKDEKRLNDENVIYVKFFHSFSHQPNDDDGNSYFYRLFYEKINIFDLDLFCIPLNFTSDVKNKITFLCLNSQTIFLTQIDLANAIKDY